MNLEEVIRHNSINFTLIATGALFLLVTISVLLQKKNEFLKGILFWSMALVIVLNTGYLSGSTLYLNHKSTTGGPVHWHADFEVWNCGREIELINPTGLSNKIGIPVIHEHNDKRMHIEGVILENSEASLGNFFRIVGGKLDKDNFEFQTNEGKKFLKNGQTCPNGKEATLQVFVYSANDNKFSQQKLENPPDYLISGLGNVPPGDCVIIEYEPEVKEKTDRLCQSYKVAEQTGKIHASD